MHGIMMGKALFITEVSTFSWGQHSIHASPPSLFPSIANTLFSPPADSYMSKSESIVFNKIIGQDGRQENIDKSQTAGDN